MKIGIVGAGAVARACLLATTMRGSATDIVVVDRTHRKARGMVADIRYGAVLSPAATLRAGDYPDLAGAELVMLTAGVNEKAGGATDRSDPEGRLKLLARNAGIFADIVPRIAEAAPEAVLLVVTDPPDALADIARAHAARQKIVSAGTFLDSLRFRVHLAHRLGVHPHAVDAQVLGEHGTSAVFVWSAARVGGVPVLDLLDAAAEREAVEKDVREANIEIIEGTGASQLGIGMVCARIAEIMQRDERAVLPLACYSDEYDVTLSLPSVLGRGGILRRIAPALRADETAALRRSADRIRHALEKTRSGRHFPA
jgi:L-lactate dehydrogenase